MQSSRRFFLSLGIPVSLVAVAAAAQRLPVFRRQKPESERQDDRADLDLTTTSSAPKPDPRILKEKQAEIKKQVQRLYDLAGELKMETDKTDSSTVLSLPVIKKAERIQKIAKQIQSLARG